MSSTYYKPGSWNIMCAVCGRKIKADDIKKRWDGLLVCENDYENRNILDFTRVLPEMGSVPYSQPEQADTFIHVVYITNAIAGIAIAGLSTSGQVYGGL